MITSFLREKTIKRKDYKTADVEFINKSDRKFSGSISFSRSFGHGVLLVTIDIDAFEICQRRLLPLNW